jgi:hypothetical protein
MGDVAGLSRLPEPQGHEVAVALADVVKAVRRARNGLGDDVGQTQWYLALEGIEERAQMMLRLVR